MSRNQALRSFSQDLYVSHSQIFKFSTCSLAYKFHYVERREPERISINLPFGKAMHAAQELYYRSLKAGRTKEPLNALVETFDTVLNLELEKHAGIPFVWKKATPDKASALALGRAMLTAFYDSIDLSGYAVVEVELPLSARLYTDDGLPTDFMLVGILDLLLMDENDEAVVVDNKTAAQPIAQQKADEDLQMSAYAYLLASNKYVFPTAPVKCRFDVLRKLKTPKLEHVHTTRTAQNRRRFAKIANAVLANVDSGHFYPQPGWMCSDCAYQEACKAWQSEKIGKYSQKPRTPLYGPLQASGGAFLFRKEPAWSSNVCVPGAAARCHRRNARACLINPSKNPSATRSVPRALTKPWMTFCQSPPKTIIPKNRRKEHYHAPDSNPGKRDQRSPSAIHQPLR